jgi:hypothetical protein
VGPDAGELRFLAGNTDDVIDSLTGELRLALGQEQPRQVVFAGS